LGEQPSYFIESTRKSQPVLVQMNETVQGFVEPVEKIAISGASGALGTALRSRLERNRVRVTQLVRGPAAGGQVRWDPAANPAVASAAGLEGHTSVIHLSGASLTGQRWSDAYRQVLVASRVDSTRALATILAGLKRPPRTLIVASAVGVYGDRGDEVVGESSPLGQGFLAGLCRAWEAAAQPARDAGIRVVHARFGVVLGPGQGALAKMVPIFRLGLGGRLGSGQQWMSWISLEDAVAAIVFALKTQALAGALNVTSPNPVTNAAFTRELAKAVRRPAIIPAPAFALRLALGPMADEALLASIRAVPSRLIAAEFQFAAPNVGDALAAALG
jgi:uncharacterized protein